MKYILTEEEYGALTNGRNKWQNMYTILEGNYRELEARHRKATDRVLRLQEALGQIRYFVQVCGCTTAAQQDHIAALAKQALEDK